MYLDVTITTKMSSNRYVARQWNLNATLSVDISFGRILMNGVNAVNVFNMMVLVYGQKKLHSNRLEINPRSNSVAIFTPLVKIGIFFFRNRKSRKLHDVRLMCRVNLCLFLNENNSLLNFRAPRSDRFVLNSETQFRL